MFSVVSGPSVGVLQPLLFLSLPRITNPPPLLRRPDSPLLRPSAVHSSLLHQSSSSPHLESRRVTAVPVTVQQVLHLHLRHLLELHFYIINLHHLLEFPLFVKM